MSESKGDRALRMRDAGLTNAEIAAALGLSKDRARGLISEARKRRSDRAEDHALEILEREYPGFEATYNHIVDANKMVNTKPVKHLFIPDPQCGPEDNFDHLEWAGMYAAEHESDVIINAGDHWDFASLSSYEAKGSKYFEGKRYKADVEAGNEGLRRFENGLAKRARPGWHPRRVLLRGNHEDRATRAVNADPRLEGVVGFHDFVDIELGWEVHDFLKPVEIDSLHYSHYFYNPSNGRPYSGNIETMLKNIGFSFVAGHTQGLRWGRRELGNGQVQIGLIAGSFYTHDEPYRGWQARSEWRGLCMLHEVRDGGYDPMFVSIDYLRRRYAK